MATKLKPSGVFALPTHLVIDVRLGSTGVHLTLRGEIDVHTAPQLRDRLAEILKQGEDRVVVHLDGVTFMDSTALGVLVGAHKAQAATGGSFELVCTKARLLRILTLTGLHKVLTVHDGTSGGPA